MSERIKIGVRVNEDVWKEFRKAVIDKHGSTRGSLGVELDNALRSYLEGREDDAELIRIENDIAAIKAMLAESEADGGADVATPSPHPSEETDVARTHPGPRAPRSTKIDYLVDVVEDRYDGQTLRGDAEDIVRETYEFQQRTVSEYADAILDRLGAEPHPVKGEPLYLWGETLDQAAEYADEE